MKEIRLTKQGYQDMERQLEQAQLRLEEATRILQEQMETSSDAEDTGLEDAKREKLQIEARIEELEDYLSKAVIVEAAASDRVEIGSVVRLRNETVKKEMRVKVVSSAEASVVGGDLPRISDDSPVGIKLLGQKEGATFVVDLESGKQVKYSVLEIGAE